LTTAAWSQTNPTRTISDNDLVGGVTYDWSSDTTYLLDGYVFLESGGILNIEPGTVIKGLATPSTGDAASALIITVGAQIFADGTATDPIIFTGEVDDTDDPDDLTATDRGLWGGLIILGDATVARPNGVDNIEGIPATQERARYGGGDNPDDDDNSGVLRYVSIRHGGDVVSNGDEINGLTLGGVGSGTTIEYVEVFANDDDGIEWFGGTVAVKYASVAFCRDDSYDYDYGWRGKGQFWFSIHDTDVAGRAGEHDGANPDNQVPFSQPTIYNATYIGSGIGSTPGAEGNDIGILLRDNAGGIYRNSIVTDFPLIALAVEDRDDTETGDAYARLVAGDLVLEDNIWFGFGGGSTLAEIVTLSDDATPLADDKMLQSILADGGNTIVDPLIGGISRTTDQMLDPRLDAGSPALTGATATPDGDDFFTSVQYKGAFGNSTNWLLNWTALDEYGYVGNQVIPQTGADCDNPIVIRDGDLLGGQTYNWTKDNCYLLDGYVFLEGGGVLNIEEGTVIKGKASPTTGDAASALIIAVGAQIFAEGTATEPIVFTAEVDDIEDQSDLTAVDRGLWGGLIILGDATVARPNGTDNIEGIPATQERARYGGGDNPDDDDNSGVLRYVSIRHGGDVVSNGDEINGLTLGGVGSGTTIEYIEVFANDDDGIEWFGGTVDVKYATVAFCRDDSYDYDYGWRGKGQFWFSIHDTDVAGRAGEHDGANPDNQVPFAQPTIFNATYIGSGVGSTPGAEGNDIGILFRDNAGGFYRNSIITDFPGIAIAVEDRDDTETGDAYARLVAGDLLLEDNIFFGFDAGSTLADITTLSDDATPLADDKMLQTILSNGNNGVADPLIAGIGRMPNGMLDPRLNATSPALFGGAVPQDDFFDQVTYRGAFGNANNWLRNWTALDRYGYLGDLVTPVEGVDCDNPIVIRDGDLLGGQTYNFTNDNCYLLDGYVFLEAGGVLNIEPGTIIKGKAEPTTGDAASALIIAVGAQIFADGAPDAPIIFTAEIDDTEVPDDLTAVDRGLWGGLIILGDATVARPNGVDNIEGIPATQERARYGGGDTPDDDDNSGVLRYVSIRHGGDVVSNGDEINGLTLGGVGSGTTIEYIEVFANDDDGIEWFGGTVNVKYASVAFCRDDSYDYDYGWRGNGQFWFSIHDTDVAGRAGEHDGANPDNQTPFAQPTISNFTYIGSGVDATPGAEGNDIGILFRDNTGGFYSNGIVTDFPLIGLAIEDRDDTETGDAYARLLADDLVISNNIWGAFGGGTTLEEIATLSDDANPSADDKMLFSILTTDNNTLGDPMLAGISRNTDRQLDPRPLAGSPAESGAVIPEGTFFTDVAYRGAFNPVQTFGNRFTDGWTALWEYGYMGDVVDVEDFIVEENGYRFEPLFPNPTSRTAQLRFGLVEGAEVEISILDMMGRTVAVPFTRQFVPAGEQRQEINVNALAAGTYFVVLRAEGVQLTQKMVVAK
jgi:hypothetical protein